MNETQLPDTIRFERLGVLRCLVCGDEADVRTGRPHGSRYLRFVAGHQNCQAVRRTDPARRPMGTLTVREAIAMECMAALLSRGADGSGVATEAIGYADQLIAALRAPVATVTEDLPELTHEQAEIIELAAVAAPPPMPVEEPTMDLDADFDEAWKEILETTEAREW